MADVLYVGLQDDDKIVSFGIDAGSGKLVRRKGVVYIINKTNPRFKAKQG